MKIHAFRLKPGCDLKNGIDKYVVENNITSGVILTCVGNLSEATLRMADASIINKYSGSYEIVSCVGTLEKGYSHIHLSLSDKDGKVIGGHLKSGSIVGITAEIVIGEIRNLKFQRKFDEESGYNELVVTKNQDETS